MPLEKFICLDNIHIPVGECLESCRMGVRCLTRATLGVIASGEHEWDGVPHVTQLLNGTMQEWLKVTTGYAIRPRSRAFALLGTRHHQELAEAATEVSELKLRLPWIQGTLDCIETDMGQVVLTDAKTWGSFKVGRALGISKVGRAPNVHFKQDPLAADMQDEVMQVNMYRIMYEMESGVHVDRMQIQCTVRDGGLSVAGSRGIAELMYVIPVPRMPDHIVEEYFQLKATRLLVAVSGGDVEPCSEWETWGTKKCRSYCDVAEKCPQWGGR